jgi:16S rRNA (guanine966-N2)-methyltransferase
MKLRIIAGTLGGRQFDSPSGHKTHPMSEKIRGALFNMLGDIEGLTILDTFSGSGAVAFEALSRGAKSAQLIDVDTTAMNTIKSNADALDLVGKLQIVQANIKGWSNNNQNKRFDIVVCDPPYDEVLEGLIVKLTKHVNDRGLLVLSWPSSEPIPNIEGFETAKHKTYGNATLVFYKKTG